MSNSLKGKKALITVASEDLDEIRGLLEEQEAQLIHTPLEQYATDLDEEQVKMALEELPKADQIIYGYKRNALFFLEQVVRYDKLEEVRNKLNFAVHESTAEVLEDVGIPAVKPGQDGSAIKLVEFMLRINRMGPTLYPCGHDRKEEIPGLLEELEIEVAELPLYSKVGPAPEELEDFQITVYAQQPDIIFFHNRSSVNRILAAYPKLEWGSKTIVAVSKGVEQKLRENEIIPDVVAAGTWKSAVKKLN
ncbi:MAG: uroporphyrinogen-III synthase [Bacteroidota bacterium]